MTFTQRQSNDDDEGERGRDRVGGCAERGEAPTTITTTSTTTTSLGCKFKCGRDVPANLNVRRRTVRLSPRKQGQGQERAQGGGAGHNKDQWTVIMDYL